MGICRVAVTLRPNEATSPMQRPRRWAPEQLAVRCWVSCPSGKFFCAVRTACQRGSQRRRNRQRGG